MKILIDARLYGLENAGLGRYINNLVDKLSVLDTENNYVILLRKKYFDSLVLPPNWKKILADYRHYSFGEQILLPFLIASHSPDLVHFPHFNVPLFFNGKFVVTIHDTLMHKQKGMDATTLPAPVYFIKRIAYHLVFKNAVIKSGKIIVPSTAVKDDLMLEYGIDREKIKIIYEGVDEAIRGITKVLVEKPYFVYAGNAYPHKNLEKLINAMKLLNTNYNQRIKLVIASSRNIFTQRLQSLVQRLNAKKIVQLIGFVKDDELGGLFKNSVAFVFPSLSEGFGLPGLEAMQSGTLVLASEIPVFSEIYGTHAIYFDPMSTDSMAGAMLKAFKMTPEERNKLIELGKKFVKKYSWTKMAKETLDIYKESVQ